MSEWNAEGGTSATVQPDVDYLLTTLTGEIRNSHLYTTLATDVGRIPGWHSIIGSYDIATRRTLEQLDTGVTTVTTQSANHATDLTALKTVLGGNTATAFTTLNTHVTDTNDATSVASQLTALNTTQGNQQATITQHTTSINGINAEYAVRVSVGASGNNRVSGFGLMANATTTDFGILADKFFIEAPVGNNVTQPAVTPFSVVTSPQTFTDSATPPNTTTLPSGVYIDGAFIKFGSITEAHIGTATIDNAHITNTLDAAKIVTGEIDTGRIKLDGVTIDSNNNGRIEIPNLGVKVGKIDNAAVDTLQLAGNAATVPFGHSAAGGVTVGVNTSTTGSITNWTDISNGGVPVSFGSNPVGYPSKVMVHLTVQMFASNPSGNNFTSLGLYIFNGTGWLEEGVVGFGMITDQSHQISTGHTFVPNIQSGASIIVRVYARTINGNSTVITGPANLQVIGCRR